MGVIMKPSEILKEEIRKLVELGLMRPQIWEEIRSMPQYKKMHQAAFTKLYNAIINSLRSEVTTNSTDVFALHIARYSHIMRENINLTYIDPIIFEDYKDYIDALNRRAYDLSNVMDAMKQKETLLGFHKTNLRVKITKRIIEDSNAREIFTRERIEKTITKLSLEDRIVFLNLIKKCKIDQDASEIKLRNSESVILGEIEQNLYAQTELKFKDNPEKEVVYKNKTPEQIVRLMIESQNKQAAESFKDINQNGEGKVLDMQKRHLRSE
jgi:hypothetical protein